jgi:hypothetical protein
MKQTASRTNSTGVVLYKLIIARLVKTLPFLHSTKDHYRVQRIPPVDSILCKLQPVYSLTPSFYDIYFIIILPPSCNCPESFPTFRFLGKRCVTPIAPPSFLLLVRSISYNFVDHRNNNWQKVQITKLFIT